MRYDANKYTFIDLSNVHTAVRRGHNWTMAIVDGTGARAFTLEENISYLRERFLERFGPDLATDPETPAGQLIGIMALPLTQASEAQVRIANSMSVDHAVDRQLDDLGTLIDIARISGTRSTVDVIVSGVAGITVPTRALVRTEGGDVFRVVEAVTIPDGGSVAAKLESAIVGDIAVTTSTEFSILTLTPGWEGVGTPSNPRVGNAVQSDIDFRRVYKARTDRLAQASVSALRSALLDIDGVTGALVVENSSASATTVDISGSDVSIPAHAILVIVEGGVKDDIETVIADRRGMGVPVVLDTAPTPDNEFYRPVARPVTVNCSVALQANAPPNVLALIRDALTALVENYELGDRLWVGDVSAAIESILGVRVYGEPAVRVATVDPTTSGFVSTIAVTARGTGYSSAPNVTITGGGGSGATAEAVISTSGEVTAINVIRGGKGYTSAPNVNVTGSATGRATIETGEDTNAPVNTRYTLATPASDITITIIPS